MSVVWAIPGHSVAIPGHYSAHTTCTLLCPVDEVIPGWEIAVKSMRRNERSQFLISPEYAFGEMGCPPRIPPNATGELLSNVSYCSVSVSVLCVCGYIELPVWLLYTLAYLLMG